MFELKTGRSLAAFVLLLFISSAAGSCYWAPLGDVIKCNENVDIAFVASLRSWKSISIEINYLVNPEQAVDQISKANINNRQDDDNNEDSNLIGKQIYQISVKESDLTLIPSELLTLNGLKHAKFCHNNIKIINLNMLPYAKELTSLDVSNNEINEFDEVATTYTSTKYLTKINLSHNRLVHIPSKCFYRTRESLEVLDLSNNAISMIDLDAFSNLSSLKLLYLSYNKLVNLGYFLYPARKLEYLYLDHNNIRVINKECFNKSTELDTLDMSFNDIEIIKDYAFDTLEDLTALDLTHNTITHIKDILLRKNIHLESLSLSYNKLSDIETGAFVTLKELNNIHLKTALTMDLKSHMFTGLKATKLDFSGSTIPKVVGTPFITMGKYLTHLNLSSCETQKISETAFDSLTELKQLDLSNNKLSNVNFLNITLDKLKQLFLQNNSIMKLTVDTFRHLISLTELDISNNYIQTLPPMIFQNLNALLLLNIVNNKLDDALLTHTFYGLDNVKHLELIYTKIIRWEKKALAGLKDSRIVNASHGELMFIDQRAFDGTKNIEILDLSFNKIQNFNVDLLPNEKLREIYLNNNELSYVSNNSFVNLDGLEVLNLANNNLGNVDATAFNSLKSLKHLDLSYNPDIKLASHILDNMQLTSLLMRSTNDQVTFLCENVAISHLDLSSSYISNISSLYVQNIKDLVSLDLSFNNITVLDRFSFQHGMKSLNSLNLSHNEINSVSPGTFIQIYALAELDLSHNKIIRIQFGALGGLYNLGVLDLSNNEISEFTLTLLLDVPSVSTLHLDDNGMSRLSFADNTYNLKKITVGGNNILCEDLVLLKSSKIDLTASSLNYYSENIRGIICSDILQDYVNPQKSY